MYPSIPGEMKNSIRPKKLAAGDGDWSVSKEIILWIINTSTGTHILSPKCITNLNQLLNTPPLASDILQEVRAHPREAQVYVPRYSRAHWSFLPHSDGPHQSESSDGLPINYISSRHRALATPIRTDEAPPNQLCGNCPTATNIFGIHRCVRLRCGGGSGWTPTEAAQTSCGASNDHLASEPTLSAWTTPRGRSPTRTWIYLYWSYMKPPSWKYAHPPPGGHPSQEATIILPWHVPSKKPLQST